jgi:hypothetical protein
MFLGRREVIGLEIIDGGVEQSGPGGDKGSPAGWRGDREGHALPRPGAQDRPAPWRGDGELAWIDGAADVFALRRMTNTKGRLRDHPASADELL